MENNFSLEFKSIFSIQKAKSRYLSRNAGRIRSSSSTTIFRDLGSISAIRNLDGKIYLKGNPITTPPVEILEKGREAVIRYFEKLEKEGKDYIYEAKLTLVGEGGAGKTSLQRKIKNEKADLPTGDERTRGIEVVDWEFQDKEGNNYTAHIWDFGGQDVYYPVHRFFLTDNAVYVLMASTRYSVHNFEYWIPTIYQFGGKSPIVLVQNCDNGNQKSWDDVNVFYTNPEYNLRKPFYKVNLLSADATELKKLKSYLEQQVADLPHIGKPVPKSWVKVREALQDKAKQTDTITYTDFENLCRTVDDEAFEKAIDIEDLGKFLHDLGIILWYYEKPELRHLVILKPEWAMNAVYKIIDDEPIQKQNGVIHQEDFERIWQEEKYRGKTHELKVMLQVFKIAFPKKHNKKDFILPARLLPIEEKNKWENNQPYLRLEYHFEFMPRGIVNQVSAELSKSILSDESVWNNAVTFKNQDGEAQMIEEYHHRKIQIKAKGKDARGLMMMIMDAVVDIVKEYRGVHPTIKVPCSCKKCQNLEKPTTFEYDELVSLQNENRKEVTCNKGDIRLPIFELLHSVGLEFRENEILFESKTEYLKEQTAETPEIFFSYAWGDAEEEGESREEVVNNLYESLKNDGLAVIRDKVDLGYQGLISEFMKNIGRGDFVIVVISDKYLKSPYCMYELYEVYRNSKLQTKDLAKKIYPIRVEKLKLDDPDFIDCYFDYWEQLEKKWENLIQKRGTRITTAQKAEHEKIKAIAAALGDLLDVLKDMNALTKELLSENNFEKIKSAIKQRIGQ
ncbi:MAG: COR domain-containing protein [Spirosomataceae bacterium]